MSEIDVAAAPTLQEQIEQQTAPDRKKFGTFSGVFVPTLLTILGVIMYLREGSVVGNAGLGYAWLIIALAFLITATTALSMSSITTNIRVGAGGAFSMISQSLGLEVGGSIGIPLYLAQALAVAMYIFGFREGWQYLFPGHPALLVDLVTFAVLAGIAFVSANLAFRIQYVILVVILASLVSVYGTFFTGALQYPITWVGGFEGFPETGFRGTNFWIVFALFFPAATGILAGANMSGDLANPRRSIPLGTLSAIALSFVIYMSLAYWLARVAPREALLENYTVMIDRALWGPAVVAGLLGATFSSGLASFVGAPRILQALGVHSILPGSEWFARITPSGEPRNALLFTGAIVFAALMLRNLNAIAPLITMFFMITYAMINVIVLIEQSLGLVSFRPVLRVPLIVPLIGTFGCLFAMFIINPVFSLVAVVIVVVVYGYLVRRQLRAPFGDMRSGLFVSVAEWAAKRVADLPSSQERTWKPNLLVPVEDARELRGTFRLIHDLTYPKGSVKILGLATGQDEKRLSRWLPRLTRAFREEDVFGSWTIIQTEEFGPGMLATMQALGGAFRPNVIFLNAPLATGLGREGDLERIVKHAREYKLGVLMFADHPKARLGRKRTINVWIRDQSPNWELSMRLGNLDLALLTAYKLKRNWDGHMNVITVVNDPTQVEKAEEFLRNLVELARFPNATIHVGNSDFNQYLREAPPADVNIFGQPQELNMDFVYRMVEETQSACLFVRDSGEENALA
ncbi:MAG: amino acid permease [Chloroflexota bacterium]|nr:amino acid permease [Chloroflexota bacterium]